MKTLCALLLGLPVLLAACGSREAPTEPRARNPALPALTIGLIPEKNIFGQIDRYQPLADYVSSKLGRSVQLRVLSRYGNILRNFESANMDGAFLGSFTYVLARQKLNLEVLARPLGTDGRSTYHGLLVVRKDSGIRTVGDLRGKSFAFVDKATTAGYLFPLALLRKNGVSDYRDFFKEAYFAGTHEDVARDVLEKRAAAGALKNRIFEDLASRDPGFERELAIIARSRPVPENGLAVRASMDRGLKERLRAILLQMDLDASGREVLRSMRAVRFIRTADEDYEPVVEYAREAGLDLKQYEYENR